MKRGIRFLAAFLSVVMIAGQSLPALAETGLTVNQEVTTENENTESSTATSETSEAEENELSTEEEKTEDKKTEEQPSDEKPETEEKENTSDEIEKPEKEETAEEDEGSKDSAEKESDQDAEKTDGDEESAKEQTEYDASYITAFAPLANTELHYEYKLGLERLMEDFPTSIGMTLGDTEVIAEVTWKCIQDYDENLGSYDFVPDLGNVKLIDGVKLPQITVIVEEEGDGATGGYIPEVKDYEIPILENDADNRDFDSAALASYYNGYEEGYLPAIRDQGSEGACWAFASIGAMEADLLRDGRVSNVDMAELHAAYFSAHDVTDPQGCRTDRVEYTGSNYLSNGGCDELTYRSMASLIGPVEEEYMPYSKGRSYVPDDSLAMNFNYASLKGAYQINVEDHDSIKQAILDHGAVTASYYATEGNFSDSAGNSYRVRYSATYNSFYGQLPRTNHRVMIVGWDDNFSKDNFVEGCKPDKDGAWLVRNSWGLNDYGNRGYFWLSYYDISLLSSKGMIAYDMDFDGYDHVYGYNGTWLCGSYGFSNRVEVTESFQVTGNEEVTAIGIETGSADLTIEVSASDGTKTVTGNMSTSLAGFYVVPLNETLEVSKGSTVDLTIHILSEEGTIRLMCDCSYNNYGDMNFIAKKDSDARINGWEVSNDPAIRLYTNDNDSKTVKTAKLKEDSIYDHAGTQKQLELTADSTVSMKDITWKSLEETIATVDGNGLVTVGSMKGSTKVIGTCPDGSIISCDVKVQPYQIEYVIPDDTKIIRMDREYYPGDSEHCKLPKHYYCGIYRPGYTLDGWCKDETLTQPVTDADLMTMAEDITVYPVWDELFFTINYHGIDDDGNYTSYAYRASGSIFTSALPYDIKEFTDPVKNITSMLKSYNETHDPLRFSYWSLDSAGKIRVDQLTTDNYDMRLSNAGTESARYTQTTTIKLYPQFEKAKYTINYHVFGGFNPADNVKSYLAGEEGSITLSDPFLDGYIFKGWYTETGFTNKVTSIDKGSNRNYELYALWQPEDSNIVKYGVCGDDIRWTLATDGTLTLTGNGAMSVYSSTSKLPWYEDCTNVKTIHIGEGITGICTYAFRNSKVTSVSLPSTITNISAYAFDGCSSLCEVRYYGNEAKWSRVTIGSYNTELTGKSIQFLTDGNPSIEQVSLILNGKVGVKFYCDFSGVENTTLSDGYMVLSGSRYEKRTPIGKAGKVTENGRTYYVFSYELYAKEMDQDIHLSVYDGSGQVLRLENGNEADDSVFTYSVYEYLKAAENLTDMDHLALTRAMAVYGAMSQGLFNGRSYDESLQQLQSVIGDTQASDEMSLFNNVSAGALSDYEKVENGTLPEGLTYCGTSLILEAGTAIRHYFKVSPGYSISKYRFSNGIYKLTPVKVKDDLYYVEPAKNIPAAQYRNVYTVTVGDYSLSYSVYSYIYAVLNGKHSNDLNNVVKAMYLYGEAADRYFN